MIRKLAIAVVPLALAASAMAQDMRTETVRFQSGTSGATISDTIQGYESVVYKIGASAGQRMKIRLEPSNLATYFNVYEPGRGPGDQALVNAQLTGPMVPDVNYFDGVLPTDGEYSVSVYMMRSAARRDEISNYALYVSIEGGNAAMPQPDYADGNQGGPDFYQVATSGGGGLNLRSAPSASASVVTRLSNGQNLRNLGCRSAEGRSWCRVATLADPGYEGWAAADFLIEGSNSPAYAAAPGGSSDGTSTERVRFAPGTSGAELTGSLMPGESRRYMIGANTRQNLYVRVASDSSDMYYQIFNPGNSFLLDQMTAAQEYRGELWQSGDHVVEVINRGNAQETYNVIIGIE
ncbi:SH3 domain-containing protein [Primorskyibacter aestuariivivens]|uniref:SH3 domain-containing protein n=1 Tax=Primorskyibacter aestuariivivens TaxID=1888912 RepID=UPI002300F350|nr:SH3 domain-containing protein [Primorskyibacter aestuariivivens]MDA7429430.1 SH3 domain-containing protein [Primorskyibacter aestuariivivens]